MVAAMRVILSGCSGGGKTSLIEELARRGYATVPEPGLRIVKEERANGGNALPWIDPAAFAHRAVEMARYDLVIARSIDGPVFFDRGLIDAAAALEYATGTALPEAYDGCEALHTTAFLVPPWRENLHSSADRSGDFTEAVAEYERLLDTYSRLGFSIEVLPRIGVAQRADLVIATLMYG